MGKLPVIQPPKTINRWRPQVDLKVMDLSQGPCSFTDGVLGWEPKQYLCFFVFASLVPTAAPPGPWPTADPALEKKNPADDLMIFDFRTLDQEQNRSLC
jgi:hypothetical protein